MPAIQLKPLARWKHVEVIYERLSSGGLSHRQRDRLRAELERALHSFQLLEHGGDAAAGDLSPHTSLQSAP